MLESVRLWRNHNDVFTRLASTIRLVDVRHGRGGRGVRQFRRFESGGWRNAGTSLRLPVLESAKAADETGIRRKDVKSGRHRIVHRCVNSPHIQLRFTASIRKANQS